MTGYGASYHQIAPNLHMGGAPELDSGRRTPIEFDVVVRLTNSFGWAWGPGTELHFFPFSDGPQLPLQEELERLADNAALAAQGGRLTLVHCQGGWNRSGLVCALALIRAYNYTPAAAIQHLRTTRDPMVLCNAHFERFLLEYQPRSALGGAPLCP